MTRGVLAATLLTAALGLPSCTPKANRANDTPKPTDAALGSIWGDWELQRIQGAGIKTPHPITMTISANGGVSGFAGVNRYTATLDLARLPRGGFKLGPIVTTRMAGPDELMFVEDVFTTAIEKDASFLVKDDELVITTRDPMFLLFARPVRK